LDDSHGPTFRKFDSPFTEPMPIPGELLNSHA